MGMYSRDLAIEASQNTSHKKNKYIYKKISICKTPVEIRPKFSSFWRAEANKNMELIND